MKERGYSFGSYRYGFNGQEKDDETKGSGNSYDFGARMYDPRLGKWLSLDPLMKDYPAMSPYSFCLNNPIRYVDIDGKWVGDRNVLLVIDAANPTSAVKSGDWIVIYAKTAQEAAQIMGAAFQKNSINNLVIGSHGNGADGNSALYVSGNSLYLDEPALNAINKGETPPAYSESQADAKTANGKALQAIGEYLKSDATVVATSCGGGNDDSFIKELYKTLEAKDPDKKLKLLMSADNTQHNGTKTNLGRPPFQAPVIKKYEDGFKQLGADGAIRKVGNLILFNTNPSNENIIKTVPQGSETNSTSTTSDESGSSSTSKSVPSFTGSD